MVGKTLWTAVLALVFASSALANFEAGQRAWRDGRADEALVEWLAAANSGDERATLMLGRMHREGLGVPQNLVEAHVAQTRIDELIAERISGQTFGGLNSKRHQQAFVFSPTGDVTGMYRGGTSIFFGGKCLGSWRVERAKVRITCRKKGTGTNVAIAEFKGDTLVGREEPTSGSGEPWTWRMNVRVGEIFDSTPTTTNTRQGFGEK